MNMTQSARSIDLIVLCLFRCLFVSTGIGSIESVRHTMVKGLELEKPCNFVALDEEGLMSDIPLIIVFLS